LSWQDNSVDETAYEIERSPDGSSAWSLIGTVGANVTSFTDGGLACETAYYYRVRAYRASDGRYSGYSNIEAAVTASCDSSLYLYLPLVLQGSPSP
jgi:hypothetical protein